MKAKKLKKHLGKVRSKFREEASRNRKIAGFHNLRKSGQSIKSYD